MQVLLEYESEEEQKITKAYFQPIPAIGNVVLVEDKDYIVEMVSYKTCLKEGHYYPPVLHLKRINISLYRPKNWN